MTSSDDLQQIVKAYDIRGVVPDQWGIETARALGAAVADVLEVIETNVPMIVGHDMRPSSPELVDAFADGAQCRGADVLIIGLCSTDGLYFASGDIDAVGAMFTASHNPAQYNGIKLCRPGAKAVGADTGLREIHQVAQRYLDDGIPDAEDHGERAYRDITKAYAQYLRELVDLSDIRPLKIVVDAGNGMGGHTVPAVLGTSAGLDELPLDIIDLYFELDGTFPNHEANPLEPENLLDLQAAVRKHQAALGLAFDGDADRCFVVDERGEPVSPSAITALVAEREIARDRKLGTDAPVVLHNLITSRIVPETVTALGAQAVRTKVGHSNIKAEMARTGAIFGGEHSAHYYFRDFWGADTGMLAAMHVLAAVGHGNDNLSQLVSTYDPYSASGEVNSRVDDVPAATRRVVDAFADRSLPVDDTDGVTLEAPDGTWWANLRPSNTEPLLRLNVEAHKREIMEEIRDEILGLVRQN